VIDLETTGGWNPVLLTTGVLPMEAHLLGPEGAFDAVVDVPSNVLLLRGDGGTVLIDAGSGSFAVDWPGGSADLVGALAEAACPPEQVDVVVLTHLDFDHCGGAALLPRARVLVPEAATPSGEAGERVIDQLRREGRLEWIGERARPVAGVALRPAPGHRAGHSVVEVGDGLVHLADLVHHPLHVEHLDWDRAFDSDVALAAATRDTLLNEMADRRLTVTASHIAGAGRIVRGGDGGLLWQAA
jgi:glyoxylase-like metal-dependent hydrolase (beta-lactamase superfamily II)